MTKTIGETQSLLVDKREAWGVVHTTLNELRRLRWDELVAIAEDPSEAVWVVGSAGTKYRVETEVFPEGDGLKVQVCVDDCGWRALVPLCDSFSISPPSD